MHLIRSTERKAVPLAVILITLALGVLSAADAGATIDFTFTISNPVRIGPTGSAYVRFKCAVSNTGTQTDTYDILRIRQDLLTGWETSVCLGAGDGGCYAPFVDSVYAGTAPCSPPAPETATTIWLRGRPTPFPAISLRTAPRAAATPPFACDR
jgi:hypothetical protein